MKDTPRYTLSCPGVFETSTPGGGQAQLALDRLMALKTVAKSSANIRMMKTLADLDRYLEAHKHSGLQFLIAAPLSLGWMSPSSDIDLRILGDQEAQLATPDNSAIQVSRVDPHYLTEMPVLTYETAREFGRLRHGLLIPNRDTVASHESAQHHMTKTFKLSDEILHFLSAFSAKFPVDACVQANGHDACDAVLEHCFAASFIFQLPSPKPKWRLRILSEVDASLGTEVRRSFKEIAHRFGLSGADFVTLQQLSLDYDSDPNVRRFAQWYITDTFDDGVDFLSAGNLADAAMCLIEVIRVFWDMIEKRTDPPTMEQAMTAFLRAVPISAKLRFSELDYAIRGISFKGNLRMGYNVIAARSLRISNLKGEINACMLD